MHDRVLNIADIGTIALTSHARRPCAEIDVTVTLCCQHPGLKPQSGVVVASGIANEGLYAYGRVGIAGIVVRQRCMANSGIVAGCHVIKERLKTDRGIACPHRVAGKRTSTHGSVGASGVVEKRTATHGGIEAARRVGY